MAKRCGDKTTFKYKVTSELVGKYVTLLICRKKKFDFASVFTEKITKEETKKIKWPDQEKDDSVSRQNFGEEDLTWRTQKEDIPNQGVVREEHMIF